MELVDAELKSEGVQIAARELAAFSKLARLLGEPFVHPIPISQPREGSYTGHDLTLRVASWFRERYGERLKLDWSPGSVVIWLRRDHWRLKLPALFGRWEFVTDDKAPTLAPGVVHVGKPGDAPFRYNCLRSVEGLTDAVRASLSPTERESVRSAFQRAIDLFYLLDRRRADTLLTQARADISAATEHLTGPHQNLGLARWASLQATEKAYKAWIRFRGEDFKHTHSLATLAAHAERLGLPAARRDQLGAIQCEPGIRYDSTGLSVRDSVHAHQLSISAVRLIALHIVRPDLDASAP